MKEQGSLGVCVCEASVECKNGSIAFYSQAIADVHDYMQVLVLREFTTGASDSFEQRTFMPLCSEQKKAHK
eukprot:412107-Amphidinium_carterae.1